MMISIGLICMAWLVAMPVELSIYLTIVGGLGIINECFGFWNIITKNHGR